MNITDVPEKVSSTLIIYPNLDIVRFGIKFYTEIKIPDNFSMDSIETVISILCSK